MKLLNHPNVIRLYEVIDTEIFLFLVMEYAAGGEVRGRWRLVILVDDQVRSAIPSRGRPNSGLVKDESGKFSLSQRRRRHGQQCE